MSDPERPSQLIAPEASPADILLRVDDLHIELGSRSILRGVTFEVAKGQTLVILGGSGSGKSTLMRSMIGVLPPVRGRVELFGADVYEADDESLAGIRKRIGVLFQSGALFNSMKVGENIALILREHTELDEEAIRVLVKMKLELVGLRGCEDLRPAELSGGMRKRVGLARALALDPEIMFYDEPGAGLDPVTRSIVDRLLKDLAHGLSVTSIVVTHHIASALEIADTMLLLYDGHILAHGPPEEFVDSDDPLVRQFMTGSPDGPLAVRRCAKEYRMDLLE